MSMNKIMIISTLIVMTFSLFNCSMANETSDTSAPEAGNSGAITVINSSKSIAVSWGGATDDTTAGEELLYQLYYSTIDNINTVEEMEANGIKVDTYSEGITSKSISGLESNSTYFINLLVKDKESNKRAYSSISSKTNRFFYTIVDHTGEYSGVYYYFSSGYYATEDVIYGEGYRHFELLCNNNWWRIVSANSSSGSVFYPTVYAHTFSSVSLPLSGWIDPSTGVSVSLTFTSSE